MDTKKDTDVYPCKEAGGSWPENDLCGGASRQCLVDTDTLGRKATRKEK